MLVRQLVCFLLLSACFYFCSVMQVEIVLQTCITSLLHNIIFYQGVSNEIVCLMKVLWATRSSVWLRKIWPQKTLTKANIQYSLGLLIRRLMHGVIESVHINGVSVLSGCHKRGVWLLWLVELCNKITWFGSTRVELV